MTLRETPATAVEAVERMTSAMRHRGPDDRGLHQDGPAALGMTRLAIFDPENGHQPMLSPDARYALVYNGAIYNFRELAEELQQSGWSFRTRCDTEVLLAAYAQWGARCLNRLRGMFAFAIWDRVQRELFLAPGPFGIKPLYYSWRDDGSLLFASELRALLASRQVAAEIEPRSVAAYLAYLSVPSPGTIFRRVRSLRPGQCAVWKEGLLTIRTYWNFGRDAVGAEERCENYQQFVSELHDRLRDSTRAHAIADVPVGAFLSGGLDSSAIVALMAPHGEAEFPNRGP